jgi:nucleotide-binding universal stress UspA family protein
MPGITVGIDGSPNAGRALDWAVREAAIRSCLGPVSTQVLHHATCLVTVVPGPER